MVEDDVVAHNQMKVSVRPGQWLGEVVCQELEFRRVTWTASVEVLRVLPRDF